MDTFVTLAEVLEARGAPLEEDDVWALLQLTGDMLLDTSSKGNSKCHIISPGSLLLSASGHLAFKNCGRSEDVSSFSAPEMLQGQAFTTRLNTEKMMVYSLGMTLYWSVDYRLPENQPVQLGDHLNGLLLSMCEDVSHRRANLLTVLEKCEVHYKTEVLAPPYKVIKQLVEDFFRDSVDHASESKAHLTDRSQMIRERLHGGSHQQSAWAHAIKSSPAHVYQSVSDRISQERHHSGSWNTPNPFVSGLSDPRASRLSDSTVSLTQKKLKNQGPEFVRSLEPQIVLELPGSIVSKKGKSYSTQRELSVVMPNGQRILVKCDVKSKGADVFDMVVAHANLVEHFYFGLAFMDDDEFFFLDHDIKISKVAPECWKKLPSANFLLFLRVKFFVDDIDLTLHRLTRHQYYLQLRKDILEDRVCCDEETGLFLGALALQAEYGDYIPQVYGKNYFQPEQYVSKRLLEKMALHCLKDELSRLHALSTQMLPEEAELEFLKVTQQLPEYGVMFHRVAQEKRAAMGELILGICAKGIIVYEVKNNSRFSSLRLQWSETDSISSTRRKFSVQNSVSRRRHTFITESSKISKYLLSLCCAQHKFYNEMNSRQRSHSIASEESIPQYTAVCRAQRSQVRALTYSDVMLNGGGRHLLDTPPRDSMSKHCDELASKMEARTKQQQEQREPQELQEQQEDKDKQPAWRTPVPSPCKESTSSLHKRNSVAHSVASTFRDTPTRFAMPEREIVCVSLRKDPKLGLGIVLIGEENTENLDLGIFIASIVPDGPADKDGRIKPGGRLISLNKTSLEGVTFSVAADIIQSCPDDVELIVSQPIRAVLERNYDSQTTLNAEYRPGEDDPEEVLTVEMTPSSASRLPVPMVRVMDAQECYSRSSSLSSLKDDEVISLELRKIDGNLGMSIIAGIDNNVRDGGVYIKSLVPGGVAEQDGRIQIGDRLLAVDRVRLRGVTHQQAVDTLMRTGEVVSLVLQRELMPEQCYGPDTQNTQPTLQALPASKTPQTIRIRKISCPAVPIATSFSIMAKDNSFMSLENTMEVMVRKSINGLGFSFIISPLDTPGESGTIVRIKTLFPGQPAEECGLIQEGDIILAVNGQPLRGMSYQKVIHLLRGVQSEVRLTLCRPAAGVLTDCNHTRSPTSTKRGVRSMSLDVRPNYFSRFRGSTGFLVKRAQDTALR
ncbi:tyrosine-protein phosphatase non-receptor type 13 [Conger conger]|uniref:tyrosine-protein phosphatase non-receptor type 13 n=1 Tax=Conger conger TaxID=82655 RepID=UPI002A5A8F35|nr:tyrosine-protein phosphatase non-receptor type 13 [Conger conger]